ncbi:MAG TPA: DUF1566 domain-containing protein [Saprospiraceae bacterium]|nr:DUF1566 domain-containing protein [Saprospiraceae bacterium]
MKKSLVLAFVLSLTIIGLDAQVVEVIGKLKVTEMDTLNGETMLVVKKSDGTLATRMSSSLPPAPDTIRSLKSDLLLTSALCNCTSLPPAMIQSLLDNGYTIQNLIGFEVSLQDVLDAGFTIQDLLDEGLTIQDLLGGGLTIQDLLDGGQTPTNLFYGGVAMDSLYGKIYAGGFIFYLTAAAETGLVAAPPYWDGINDPDPIGPWGCWFVDIPGAQGTAIGTGAQNTIDIEAGCGTSGIAADLCANLVLHGFNDWFLPSKDELNEMYLQVGQGAAGPNQNIGGFANGSYWTSTEENSMSSWFHEFNINGQYTDDKEITYRVRPVRAF